MWFCSVNGSPEDGNRGRQPSRREDAGELAAVAELGHLALEESQDGLLPLRAS